MASALDGSTQRTRQRMTLRRKATSVATRVEVTVRLRPTLEDEDDGMARSLASLADDPAELFRLPLPIVSGFDPSADDGIDGNHGAAPRAKSGIAEKRKCGKAESSLRAESATTPPHPPTNLLDPWV